VQEHGSWQVDVCALFAVAGLKKEVGHPEMRRNSSNVFVWCEWVRHNRVCVCVCVCVCGGGGGGGGGNKKIIWFNTIYEF
jgi:hypothetical protein